MLIDTSQKSLSLFCATGGNSSESCEAGINSVCCIVLRALVLSCANLALCAANLVLQDTIERIYASNLYADVPRGIFVVRGENVLLLGEVVSIHCQARRCMILIVSRRTSTAKTIFPPP